MNGRFTESIVEDAALAWLEALGYAILHSPDIAPGEPAAERSAYERLSALAACATHSYGAAMIFVSATYVMFTLESWIVISTEGRNLRFLAEPSLSKKTRFLALLGMTKVGRNDDHCLWRER